MAIIGYYTDNKTIEKSSQDEKKDENLEVKEQPVAAQVTNVPVSPIPMAEPNAVKDNFDAYDIIDAEDLFDTTILPETSQTDSQVLSVFEEAKNDYEQSKKQAISEGIALAQEETFHSDDVIDFNIDEPPVLRVEQENKHHERLNTEDIFKI